MEWRLGGRGPAESNECPFFVRCTGWRDVRMLVEERCGDDYTSVPKLCEIASCERMRISVVG